MMRSKTIFHRAAPAMSVRRESGTCPLQRDGAAEAGQFEQQRCPRIGDVQLQGICTQQQLAPLGSNNAIALISAK
jgi:hypothetical protein